VKEVDSYLLTTVMMWMGKTTVSNTERLIEQYFKYEEVHKAQGILCENMGKEKPKDKKTINKLQRAASELVLLVQELEAQEENKKVRVVVTPTSLAMVPLMESTWGEGEIATAARLLALERQMTEIRVDVAKIASTPAPVTTYKDVVVREDRPVAKKDRPAVQKTAVRKEVPAEVAAGQRGEQEEEAPFQVVDNRKKGKKAPRKVQYGTGQVTVGGDGGEAAPYEVWIGNTHPASTKEIITEVLLECGRRMEGGGLQEELKILDVECLTKPRDDGKEPYTKQWRVKVPNRFREHMKLPGAYQIGWSTRRFFPARSSRPKVAELTMGARRGSTGSAAGNNSQ